MHFLFLYIVFFWVCVADPWWYETNILDVGMNDNKKLSQLVAPFALNCSPAAPVFEMFNQWSAVGVRLYSKAQHLILIVDADISLYELQHQQCNVTISSSPESASSACIGHTVIQQYYSISDSVLSSGSVQAMINKHKFLIIAGHGFGGTVAQLFSFQISALFKIKRMFLITYGSPAAGNILFSRGVCKDVECYHWRNEFDYFWSFAKPEFKYDISKIFSTSSTSYVQNEMIVSSDQAEKLLKYHHYSYFGVDFSCNTKGE